jgi:hypothetical protein
LEVFYGFFKRSTGFDFGFDFFGFDPTGFREVPIFESVKIFAVCEVCVIFVTVGVFDMEVLNEFDSTVGEVY